MAVNYLENNGFQILERNFHCKMGEIDIIAFKDNIIRFIEVKYRGSDAYGFAIQSISPRKQQRIYNTAQFYLMKNKTYEQHEYSFDVITIQGNDLEYFFDCFGAM